MPINNTDALASPPVFELAPVDISRFAQRLNGSEIDALDPQMATDPEIAAIMAKLEAMLQDEALAKPDAPPTPESEEKSEHKGEDENEDEFEDEFDAEDHAPPNPDQIDGPGEGGVAKRQEIVRQEPQHPHHHPEHRNRVRKLYCKENVRRHRNKYDPDQPRGSKSGQGQLPGGM